MPWTPPEDAVLTPVAAVGNQSGWAPPADAVPIDALSPEQMIELGDPGKVEKFTQAAEMLSGTPPLGIGEHMIAPTVSIEDRELFKAVLARQYAQDQSAKKAGYGKRLGVSFVQGAIDRLMPLAKRVPGSPIPKLDPDQERFRQELLSLREGIDPTIRPDTPVLGRGLQQAARMAEPMISSVGAGKAMRGGAALAGVGRAGQTAATAVGTSGSFLPQIAEQTYNSLIGENVDPNVAWKVTAISAPIEAAVESILPDPLSGYGAAFRGTARQVIGKLVKQHTVNFTKELTEEVIQRIVNEAALEVGRKMDETVPNQGFSGLLSAGLEEIQQTALPLAIMMAPGAATGTAANISESASRPGRLEQLREIRAAKPQDLKRRAAEAGITGTRKEVREKLDQEIKAEQEAQDAQAVRGPEAEVREDEGREDLRERREVEVSPEQTGEVAPAPEVQVEPTPEVDPTELARRAARGEDVARPEGVSLPRWVAMVDQMRKRMGLKPKPVAPQPAPEAASAEEAPTPAVEPEAPQEAVPEPEAAPEAPPAGEPPARPKPQPPPEAPPVDTTGTKNVKTDELRAAAALGERPPVTPEQREEWDAEASRRIDDDPLYPQRLAQELSDNPRGYDPVEDLVLSRHLRDLENRRQAGEDVRNEMLTAVDASEKVGTIWGRTGVARQAERAADFSLEGIVRQHVRATQKAPTDEQMAKYEEIADRLTKAEAVLSEVEVKLAQRDIDEQIIEAKKSPRAKKGTKREVLQRKAADATRQFKDEWESLYQVGAVADPRRDAEKWAKITKAAGRVIKAYAELGVNSFLELMARVKADIGAVAANQAEAFREAWDDARGRGEVGMPSGAPPEAGEIGEIARDLTRWAVEQGIEGREQVINAVHDALQEMGIDVSRSEAMRAMSGYGEFRELPADDVSVKVRGIRGEIQQLLKLESMQEGRAPEKTGIERRVPTDEERRLIKEVNEAKKRGGYTVTDPTKQLESALTTAKTTATNRLKDLDAEIRDLEQSIATRTLRKTPDEKTTLKADKELESLRQQVAKKREQRDELKKEYEKIFPPTPKQRKTTAKQQADAAQRQIDRIQQQLKDIREGRETQRKKQPDLLPKKLKADLEMWRQRLKAAKKAAAEAELARFEGEGGALKQAKGRKPLTDEQRLKAAEKMIIRLNQQLEADITAGRLRKDKKAPVTSTLLEDQKKRRETLREALRQAQEADPQYQAEEAARETERYKKALERQLAFWEKRRDEARRGKLSPKRIPKTRTEKEILEKQADIAEVKKEAAAEIARVKREQRPGIQKAAEIVPEALNALRALKTSFDLSAVLRQGGVLSAAHPMISKDAIAPMLEAFATERGQTRAMEIVKNLPTAEMAKKAGLEITTDEMSLSAMEEAYMSRFARNIPGVRHSERAYMTFLNLQRAMVFDELANTLGKKGKVTDTEARIIANWVNIASGRGELARAKPAAAALATFFFAPRYMVSRFQLMLGQPLWTGLWKGEGGARARALVAQEYARAAGALGLFYTTVLSAAAMLWDPDDEDKPTLTFDERSSDFGKPKFGETRIDPLAGFAQVTTLLGRIGHGETVNQRGEVRPLVGEDVPYGGRDIYDVLTDFLRGKLSPAIGTAIDIRMGENIVGDERSMKTELVPFRDARRPLGAATPLVWEDVYEAMEAQGVPAGTAIGTLAILGWGSQTYGEYTKYKQADAAGRKEQFEKFLNNVKWNSSTPAYSSFLNKEQIKAVEDEIAIKKGGVLYGGLQEDPTVPERKEGLSDLGYQKKLDSYKKNLETRQKAREKLAEMIQTLDLGHDKAQNLLRQYYRQDRDDGEYSLTTGKPKPSYEARGVALGNLYGQDFYEWWKAN